MWKTRPTNVVAMRRLLSMNELGRCALVQSEAEVPEEAVHGPNTVALEGAPNFAHVHKSIEQHSFSSEAPHLFHKSIS